MFFLKSTIFFSPAPSPPPIPLKFKPGGCRSSLIPGSWCAAMGISWGYYWDMKNIYPENSIFFGINQQVFFSSKDLISNIIHIYSLYYNISIVWMLHDFIANCHIELDTASICRSLLVHTSVEWLESLELLALIYSFCWVENDDEPLAFGVPSGKLT